MQLQTKPPEQWTAKDNERVLCVSRHWMENAFGHFHGYCRSRGFMEALRRCNSGNNSWSYLPRGECETDPQWKQLIPYMLVFHAPRLEAPDPEILCYRRTRLAGETRLHDRQSIGFGGHIGPADGSVPVKALVAGLQRELQEELEFAADYRVRLLGLINEDSTPVGSVHLGVVMAVELCDNRIRAKDAELAEVALRPSAEIFGYYDAQLHDDFEGWSKTLLTCHSVIRDGYVAEGPVICRSNS